MNLKYSIFIVLIVILSFYVLGMFKYSSFNTTRIPICSKQKCEVYNVHKEHHNPKDAAMVLDDISRRNSILLDHLKSKYANSTVVNGLEPTKNNRIDVIGSSEIYNPGDVINFMNKKLDREFLQERIIQLLRRYDEDNIHEISPRNSSGATSFTENKTKLVLCLRKKHPNRHGLHELHDNDLIMFVVLHELAHMMNDKWGHPNIFWSLFKFMLLNSVECGVYKPTNYRYYPVNYCGLNITYNPLYDPAV